MGLSSLILRFVPQQFFFTKNNCYAVNRRVFFSAICVLVSQAKGYHVTPRHSENLWRAL